MALLRPLCFPSTTSFLTQQSECHQSTSLCCSSPLSLFKSSFSTLSYSLPIKTKRPTRLFPFQFSCFSSSSLTVSFEPSEIKTETEEEEEEDETSRTRLIAQNVPWTCKSEDIRALFEKHGSVLNVELSMYNKTRNRGLAFVTMGSPEEALAALSNLESYEFEGRTLKVNYANPKKKSSPPVQKKPVSAYNLFVANFSYEARAKDLREFFDSGSGKVVSAEVIFHENPRRSSGYGFVSFRTKEDAEAALSSFQGKMFMGRPIRVARSKRFVRHEAKASAQSEDMPPELNSENQQTSNADEI